VASEISIDRRGWLAALLLEPQIVIAGRLPAWRTAVASAQVSCLPAACSASLVRRCTASSELLPELGEVDVEDVIVDA
jgi:hypothetical protein